MFDPEFLVCEILKAGNHFAEEERTCCFTLIAFLLLC